MIYTSKNAPGAACLHAPTMTIIRYVVSVCTDTCQVEIADTPLRVVDDCVATSIHKFTRIETRFGADGRPALFTFDPAADPVRGRVLEAVK